MNGDLISRAARSILHSTERRGWRVSLSALVLSLILLPVVSSADEFIITPGDELRVFIPGLRPPDQTVVVDPSGRVDLGIHGKVKLSGNSIDDAQALLKTHLSKYLKSTAGVTVLLQKSRRTVLITGCVAQPGIHTVDSGVDLWQSLHQAGGVTACADLTRVTVLRNGLEMSVNVRAFLTRDSTEPLPSLRAGDTIFVPGEPGMPLAQNGVTAFLGHQAIKRKVFVIGAVTTPGMFDRSDALDVLTAVSLAGGPTPLADLSHATLLTKKGRVVVNLQKALAGKKLRKNLLPGDGGAIIYLPTLTENIDSRLGSHVNVIGPFERTGRIPVSGPIKLIDIIGIVGGPMEEGKIHEVSVIREGPGYTLVTEFDVGDYLENGGWVGRAPVYPGSTVVIGRRNRRAFEDTLRILSTMAMLSTTVALWLNLTGQIGPLALQDEGE